VEKCNRCGLGIPEATIICPACGYELINDEKVKSERDYYTLLDISPKMSGAEITIFIKNATRVWVARANSPQIDQRHKAEMMLEYLAEAENVLVDPIKRKNYDDTRKRNSSQAPETSRNDNTGNKKSEYPSTVTCSRCGLRQKMYSAYCSACGFKFVDFQLNPKVVLPVFSDSKANNEQFPSPSEEQSYDITPVMEENSTQKTLAFFGWNKLTGTVIAIEPPYFVTLQKGLFLIFLKIAFGILFLPILLGVLAAIMIMQMLSPFSRNRRYGHSSSLSSHIVGFFLTQQLIRPKEQISVRDIRLRDKSGQEHLVRIQGQLVNGNMIVGDEVEVEGFNRRGTLMVRRGFNKRTRSEIRIRRI